MALGTKGRSVALDTVHLTVAAEHLLEAAAAEAKSIGLESVGEEHILLALTKSKHNPAIAAMNSLGFTAQLKERLSEILASEGYRTPSKKGYVLDSDGNILASGVLRRSGESGRAELVDDDGTAVEIDSLRRRA